MCVVVCVHTPVFVGLGCLCALQCICMRVCEYVWEWRLGGREGGSVKALGFRGIEAREKRKRRRSSHVFVCTCAACMWEAATAEKQQRKHCLINQHQKTALKMNGTRSNSLAKVNYSGVELTPLPNILLRTKILIFFFSSCPHLVSVCNRAAKFAAEDQCLLCQGNF